MVRRRPAERASLKSRYSRHIRSSAAAPPLMRPVQCGGTLASRLRKTAGRRAWALWPTSSHQTAVRPYGLCGSGIVAIVSNWAFLFGRIFQGIVQEQRHSSSRWIGNAFTLNPPIAIMADRSRFVMEFRVRGVGTHWVQRPCNREPNVNNAHVVLPSVACQAFKEKK